MSTKVLFIRPDMSFIELPARIEQNFVRVGKDRILFSYGRSVFRERLQRRTKFIRALTFWKKRRNLLIAFEGANQCFEVKYDPPLVETDDSETEQKRKIRLRLSVWSKEEADEYTKKQLAKAQTGKILGGWRFWLLLLVNVFVVFYIMFRFR